MTSTKTPSTRAPALKSRPSAVTPQIPIHDLGALIHRLAQTADNIMCAALADAKILSITPRQITVLHAIRSHADKPSQTDIVAITGIDRSTLATMIGALMKRGYIARATSKADARAYEVRLTQSGEQVVHRSRAALRKADGLIADAYGNSRANTADELRTISNRLREEARNVTVMPLTHTETRA